MKNEISNYIPHRRKMLLLDEVSDSARDNFTTSVVITKSSPLALAVGVPSYCGIEYMAQSIAAFNSFFEKKPGLPKIGFIVSVRSFKTTVQYYDIGSKLFIKVTPALMTANSGTFACEININGRAVSSARITAYVPTEEELERLKENA